jgi:hypothetical protein
MLGHPSVHAERTPDMKKRDGEGYPAENLVKAQREGTGGIGPWTDREHAEYE